MVAPKKKVLFTSHTANFHKFNRPFMRMLKEQGYTVHYASAGEEKVYDTDKHFDVPFERSPFKPGNIKAYFKLKKIIDAGNYDLIHTHTPMGSVVTRLAARAARKKGTRVIYTAHGFHFFKGAPLLNWIVYYPIEKFMARHTDTLITINNEDYERAKAKFKTEVEYVPGVGVDESRFETPLTKSERNKLRKSLGIKPDDFVMIYPAELSKRKRQLWLIDALSIFLTENSAHLLLPGKDSLNGRCHALVAKFKLENKIHFLGYRNDIPELMMMSDLAVSSSSQEGLPVNLLEALAAGLPIVASDCRGNRDVKEMASTRFEIVSSKKAFNETVSEISASKKGKKSSWSSNEYAELIKNMIGKIYARNLVISNNAQLLGDRSKEWHIGKKRLLSTLIFIPFIVLVVLTGLLLEPLINVSMHGTATFWGICVSIGFILFLWLLKLRTGSINNPFVYFTAGVILCWFGQVYLQMFNIVPTKSMITNSFDSHYFYSTLMFATLSFYMLCLAAILFSSDKPYSNHTKRIDDPVLKRALNMTGLLMVGIGFYQYFSAKITNLVLSLQYGYGEIFNETQMTGTLGQSTDNILASTAMFFVPGMIILLVANKDKSRIRKLIVFVLMVSMLISLIAGGRGEPIALMVALLWIYSVEIFKFRFRQLLLVGLLGLFLVGIFNTIADFRIAEIKTADVFIQIYIDGGFGLKGIADILNEFGFNIYSLYHTMLLVPLHQDFAGGYTYLASILAIIPSIVFGGYSFAKDAALPTWLQEKMGLDYGPGYSISAEAYYNFGWLGIAAIFILAWLLVLMLSNNKKDSNQRSIRNIFVAVVLFSNLFIARDTTLMVFREFFYTVVIPMAILYLIYSVYSSRRRNDS